MFGEVRHGAALLSAYQGGLRAGLNRATFYARYSDCFALLESIEEDQLEAFCNRSSWWIPLM